MVSRRVLLLAILLFVCYLSSFARNNKRDIYAFQFTSPVYNVSLEENARGKEVYAVSNEPIRVGVPLPSDDAIVKFKIVEGDKQYFKAEAKTVGDFAFLRIRHRNDGILNRELKDSYEFLIKASCRRRDATNLETTATVNLFVTDHNDARPIFERDEYRADIKQDVPPFTTILQVQASDADIALNSQIYYSLVDSSLDFMVDPISGAVRNLRYLDPGTYELSLLAEDRASRLFRTKVQTDYENDFFNHNKAKAVITVDKVEKSRGEIKLEVKPVSAGLWNSSQIAAVARIEGDTAAGDSVRIEIVDGSYADVFTVKRGPNSSDTWLVETVRGIRPKADWFIQLKAVTFDDSEYAVENVSLQVINKRFIQFEAPVTRAVVNESVPLGYVVTQLKAHVVDGFDGDEDLLRYSFLNSSRNIPFSVDEKTGHLRVIQWLDYENTSSYRFAVSAQLMGYGLEGTEDVEVTVVDSNDHCPVFAAKWARGDPVALPRNYPLNKVLLKAEALDVDSGANGRIRYVLEGEGSENPFSINPDTGEVVLRQKPRQTENLWKLRIRASDSGWPLPRSSEILISIYLNGSDAPPKIWPSLFREPDNEHSPIFSSLPVLNVSADAPPGKVLGRIEAFDSDAGYAGLLRFGSMDKFFGVEPFSGEIFLLGPLSGLFTGENKTELVEHTLDIVACDWGEPAKCTGESAIIRISEANIHAPCFEKPFYRVRIAENTAVGSEIVVLFARDEDFGNNGLVGYQIIGDGNHFGINESTGVLEVRKKLDREAKASHRLTVMAFDHGHPMKVAFVNVTVVLIDVNDNAPLCAESSRKIIIPEDYPNNALVTCLAASDPDEGKNGAIAYALDSTMEQLATIPFRVQEDTGCVFVNTNEPFDFETTKLYNLSIEVMDNGEPMLSSVCTLFVEISDVNENLSPPLFDDIAQETTVYENMPMWTEVLALHAVDPDNAQMPVKYAIIDGDGMGSFSIDSEGILRTTVVLDREASDSYWLTVEASDLAPVPLSSVLHVFVRVLDRNDHVPFSPRPIYFSGIPENSPEDTVVVKVEAEDKDELPNKHSITNVRYKIVSGDPQSFFTIDSKTGYVVTRGKRRLDRETQKEHFVTVELCDQGDPKLCSTVPVVITISDLNDNPPYFKQASYSFNVPAGETGELCRIFAVDVDEDQNAVLFYNLSAADPHFFIDNDGRINSAEPLKANEVYQLIVKASDGGRPQHTSSPLSVTLNAIGRSRTSGNGKPRLLNEDRWTRLSISDADSIGETIGLIEAEDPDGDQLWWRLVDGNYNNTFAIRCDAGELYLAKSLDFIRQDIIEVQLKFIVSDGLDTTEGTVVIEISRAHWRRPEFSAQHYKIQVSREVSVGTVLLTLKASVEQLNGTLSDQGIVFGIHLVEDIAAAEKVRVDPSSGEVVVVETFTDIVSPEFTTVIYARFNQMTNYALLSISLRDGTHKPPKCVVSEYFATLPAGTPVGATVVNVRGYDPEHGDIRYSIVEGNESGFFGIDEVSGTIRLTSSLLSYSRADTLLTVQVSKQQNDYLTDRCSVRITVLVDHLGRVNFPQSSYALTLRESTPPNTVVYTLSAHPVTNIRYTFRDPCPSLSLHPISGAISTKLGISATRSPYTCTIIGRNSMGAEDLLELTISVVSENQYAPFFGNTIYQGFIRENMTPGSPVLLENGAPLLVKAIDHDKGINGLVSYRIVSPSDPYFTVDYLSGAVLTRAGIDFEKVKNWSFYIQASDSGSSALSSAVPALVQVTVQDVNDMPPAFSRKEYNAHLLLPTLKGTTVCEVMATDEDTVGLLRYAVVAPDDKKLFAVEQFTGRVYANADTSTDYTRSSYRMDVIVSDGMKSDSAVLIVRVLNTSSIGNVIRFSKANYEASVTENVTSSVAVHLFTVNAKSSGRDGLLYSMLNQNKYFTIGATSGLVSWTGVLLDREQTPTVQFIVQARRMSGGNERAQSIVTIRIEDKNDCEPHFLGVPYEIAIAHDFKLGDKVVGVKAIDADEGLNGVVRYKLKTKSPYFDINKYDGRIVVKRSLEGVDFDTIKLDVVAEDQGKPSLSSQTTVLIHIVDRKVPIFSSTHHRAHILESAAIGSSVLDVHAVSSTGGRIGYVISHGNDDNHFRIDFDTGVISVRRTLDREKCAFYNLSVAAVDVTRPGVRAYSYVAIEVDDVSDSAPQFRELLYDITVSESIPIGTQLLKVEAVDPDVVDSFITYGITGPDASILSVDPQSGIISLMKPLDFEAKRCYKFRLTVSDAMQLTSEADLVMHVDDTNDVAPKFMLSTVESSVEEGDPPGRFVAKLDAFDEDTVANLPNGTRFVFSVIDGDETLVVIEPSTGVVWLSRSVARDDLRIGEKRFNVSVSDGIFTGYCLLKVKIRSGMGQQPPRFQQTHYTAAVRENGAVGMTVTSVSALYGASPLQYSFGGQSGPLAINETTGRIYTRLPFDYEARRSHRFVLVAADADDRRAFATLTVNVLDENDNTPQFVAPTVEASVSAGSHPGESVLMVLAVDNDAGDELEYTILAADESHSTHFSIHPKQGLISVQNPLSSLVGEQISLFIRVTDSANPPHQSEASVILNVIPADVRLPRFSSRHYLFSVSEDVAVGTTVGRLQQDSEREIANAAYSLVEMDHLSDFPFSLKRDSGHIVVSSSLNYEKDREIRFLVSLHLENQTSAKTISLVTVRITDVNDNKPRFGSSLERVLIPEDSPIGSGVTVLSATDPDAIGPNSKIRYFLEGDNNNGTFFLDQETGWLTLAKRLDREQIGEYTLSVSAQDEGRQSTRKIVTVVVTDINDSPPQFTRNNYFVEYSLEDLTPGQEIQKLSVHDPDLYPNNVTKLYIISGNEHDLFRLDMDTLFLRRLPIAFPVKTHLLVMAFDGKYATTTEVTVELKSNASEFQCKPVEILKNVTEDAPAGTVIFSEHQKLPESFKFSLSGMELELFGVDGNGTVVVREKFHSHFSNKYELILRAEGAESICIRHITINVEKVSIMEPVFKQPVFHGTVKENINATMEERTFATRLEVIDSDPDVGGIIAYRFASDIDSQHLKFFGLDSETGVITAISALDREIQDHYELPVLAVNGAGHTAKAKVVIDVMDVNDNAPLFEQNAFHLRIAEDEALGLELIQLKAYGGDGNETVTYQLRTSSDVAKYLSIDRRSGLLSLASSLDFEQLERFSVAVVATDSGTPPLSSECTIDIEVLDVNDNPPRFGQALYNAAITENLEPGVKVLQVLASDPDSEHFGRVSYLITNDAAAFSIGEDGWIITREKLDREVKSSHRFTVKAMDGGTPPLSDTAVVVIDVKDENDNAPIFNHCNMTAVVQEGVEPGYVILPISITDNDIDTNGGPFKLELSGDGASAFGFDSYMNLITTRRLTRQNKKEVYLLSIKAFDSGGLSTECPLTIFVKEESRHSPQASPMKVVLNTLMGEFLGGKVGRVMATDEDSADMLRYSVVGLESTGSTTSSGLQGAKIPFTVDSETGDIIGEADILAGTYRFNVSVTDGKFVTKTPITVDVSSIDQDALDHSVSIRIHDLMGDVFFTKHVGSFIRSLSRLLNVKPQNIHILSVQTAPARRRRLRSRHLAAKSSSEQDLDILFTVSRSDSRGYHRPNFIRQRLEESVAELSDDIGAEIISVMTEVCRRDVCVNGECRDRLYLDDSHRVYYTTDQESFNAPRHLRTYECTCRVGYGGKRCDIPVDKCSRDQCTKEEMCVPMNTDIGFECVCPPGTTGDRCAATTCGKEKRECSQDAEISVGGDGFFQINVANSVERRLELTISFRTTSIDAVVMHAAGNSDFHIIEIEKRYVQYRWECGTGIGTVKVTQQSVSDGRWHSLKVSRRSRHAKLVLDEVHEAEGDSPPGSDVINLYRESMRLTFGAMVSQSVGDGFFAAASDLRPVLSKGMIGCFGRIFVDGYEIPKAKQGLTLYNTRLNCNAVGSAPCAAIPCLNEGTCIPTGDNFYSCMCPPRYGGSNCELDLSPCLSRPCPPGVQCINLQSDFYCSCPHGFTGKTCQLRGGWDPCTSNPCGQFGSCIRLPHSAGFICNCSHGYSGTPCRDLSPSLVVDGWPFNTLEIIGLVIVVLLVVVIAALVIFICLRLKRSREHPKPAELEYETNNYNPRVSKSYDSAPQTLAPPPLPPRGFRMHNSQLSNYEKSLPTVQVRPLSVRERKSSSSIGGGSRSPSLAPSMASSGRHRCHRRVATPGSSKNGDLERWNGSCDEAEPLADGEELRRYGQLIDEDDHGVASCSSLQRHSAAAANLHRRSPGSKNSGRTRRLRNVHRPEEQPTREYWLAQCDRRINGACDAAAGHRSELVENKCSAVTQIAAIGSAVGIQDDDYMTMRPLHRRVIPQSAESQRRPLLDTSDSDGMEDKNFFYPDELKPSERRKPPPPAHNNRRQHKASAAQSSTNPVYDEPTPETSNSNKPFVKKAQSTPELIHSSGRFEAFCNIDDSDGDKAALDSTSSCAHRRAVVR